MSLLGNIQINYIANIAQFASGNKQVQQGLRDTEEQGSRSGSSLWSAFTKPVSAVLNFGSQLGMTVFGIQQLAQSAIGLGQSFLGPAASMEQVRIGFTTLLKDGQKAASFLKDLKAFADISPFTFSELTGAAQRMLAFGFSADRAQGLIKSVSNAVAAMGGSAEGIDRVSLALGQMQAKGKVSAEEMLQLTEAGIPAWDMLAKGMGKSTAEVQKMAEQGLIPASQALDILQQQMDASFGGAAQAQAGSFNGLISTLKDKFEGLMVALGTPVLKLFESGLSNITNLISGPQFEAFTTLISDRLVAGLSAVGNWLGSYVAPMFAHVRDVLGDGRFAAFAQGLLPKIGGILQTIGSAVLPIVQNAFNTLVDVLGSKDFQAFVGTLMDQLKPALEKIGSMIGQVLVPVFNALKTVLTSSAWKDFVSIVGTVLNAELSGLGWVITSIIVPALNFLVGGISTVLGWLDQYYKILMALPGWLGNVGSSIVSFVTGAWDAVTGFFSTIGNAIASGVQSALGRFASLGSGIWDTITGAFNSVMTFIQDAINFIAGLFVWLYQHNTYFQMLVDTILAAFTWLKATATAIWTGIVGFLQQAWLGIQVAAQVAWGLVQQYIIGPIQTAWNFLVGVFTNVKNWLVGVWSSIGNDARGLWTNFTNAITSTWSNVTGWIGDHIVNPIKNTIQGLINQALSWGSNLIQMFINGILGKLNDLKNALGNAAGAVADFLGFHSPPKEGPLSDSDTYAPNFVKMFSGGILSNLGTLRSAISTMASSVQGPTFASDIPTSTGGTGGSAGAGPVILNTGPRELVLEIDGQEFARVAAPLLGEEVSDVVRRKLGTR